MKIKDVVRGVEEKTYQNTREWMNGGAYRADGYNSLASAEVVVDRDAMCKVARETLFDVDCDLLEDIVSVITTAIESGSIISLKGKE